MRAFAVLVCVLMICLLVLGVVTAVLYLKSAEVLRGYPDISFSVDLIVNESSVYLSGYGLEASLSGHKMSPGRIVYDLSLGAYLKLNNSRTYIVKTMKLSGDACSMLLNAGEVKRKLAELSISGGEGVFLVIIPSFNSLMVISNVFDDNSREPLVSVRPWSPLLIKIPLKRVGEELRFRPSEVLIDEMYSASVTKESLDDSGQQGIHYHIFIKASKEGNQPISMVEYIPNEAVKTRQFVMNTLVPLFAILAIFSSVATIVYLLRVKFLIF